MFRCRFFDPPMFVWEPWKVLRRTLEGSLENLPRFRNRPSKVIFLRFCIQKNRHSNIVRRRLQCSHEKTPMFSKEDSNVLKTPLECSFLDKKRTSFHASILIALQPSFHVGNYLSVKHTYHTRSVGSIVLRVGYHNNGCTFVVEFL